MVAGILLTIVVVLAAPRLLKPDGGDGFFRPRPNPDAQPAASTGDADDGVVADGDAPMPRPGGTGGEDPPSQATQYDFYTLLPGQEVAMTDAELAASARAEADRQAQLERRQAAANPDAADLAVPGAATTTLPPPPAIPTATVAPATPAAGADGSRYILQAGSFGASGDAEALKARIALLGLRARVESAEIGGRTMYRVRMGPYGTASDLAEAKQKLGNGGLPALAIRAN